MLVGTLAIAGVGALLVGSGLYGPLGPSVFSGSGPFSVWRLSNRKPDQFVHDALLNADTPARASIDSASHGLSRQARLLHASGVNPIAPAQPLLNSTQFIHHPFSFYSSKLLAISVVLAVSALMAFAILDARKALRRARADIHRLRKATVSAMTLVASAHDDETGAHLKRCSLYAKAMGRQLQLESMPIDDDYVEALSIAVPLHDIGKVGIPDSVLKKPGKHSADEQIAMRLHPEIGERIISLLSEEADIREKLVFEIAKDVTIAHHENWDGSGYPAGCRGEDIPFSARIMAIIDVYDAVSSRRCYKEARPHHEVLGVIQSLSGTKFDPALVASFLSVSDQFRRIFEENPDHLVIQDAPRGVVGEPVVCR